MAEAGKRNVWNGRFDSKAVSSLGDVDLIPFKAGASEAFFYIPKIGVQRSGFSKELTNFCESHLCLFDRKIGAKKVQHVAYRPRLTLRVAERWR